MSYTGEARRTTLSSLGAMAGRALTITLSGIFHVIRTMENRRELSRLGAFDDRMLHDIGLSRSDVRDAVSQPLWRDPTAILVMRSVERRSSRRMAMREARREEADRKSALSSQASVTADVDGTPEPIRAAA